MTNPISRKEFLLKTVSSITGLRMIPRQIKGKESNGAGQLRKLGNTGIVVSSLCFGAPRTNDESLIRYSLEKGINFIDTGRSYGNGNNEKLVGRAISGLRKKVIIQSKIRLDPRELPTEGKGKKGAEEIRNALSSKLEASLRDLKTDYIDIMLYHDASDENLLFHSETMKYFDEMKKSGVIKADGFSTHNEYMNLLSRNNNETFYDVMMIPFNHKGSFVHSVTGSFAEWDQNKQISILSEAGEKGIGIIAMKTCSGGPYSPTPGAKSNYPEAVRWVLQHKFISAAAIAIANFEQVNEYLPLLRV